MQEKELSCVQVFSILGVLALVGVFLWQMPGSSGESDKWAAWVQAFGSIGAIGGAFSIANSARRHEAIQRKAADRARAVEQGRVGYMLAKEATKAFKEVAFKVKNHRISYLFQPETRRLHQIVDLLQNFITGGCPPEMAADLIWLQGQIAHALEHLERLDGARLIDRATVQGFESRHERAVRTAVSIRHSLTRMRTEGRK